MYTAAGQPDREQLVQHYLPLVKRIAFHMMARLPANIQPEDLVQNGMIGLLDAISRYEDNAGAQFETYAGQRIRGAMLDSLRENDWLPRHVRSEMRRVESALQQLEHQKGRAPSEGELAANLEMSLPDYQRFLQGARGHQLLYLEDFASENGEAFLEHNLGSTVSDPSLMLEDKNLRQVLAKAIATLPEREQLVMALYYDEELNQKEIGEIMGLTESRICQLHNQAITRIRSHLFDVSPKKVKSGKKGQAHG